MQTKMLKQEDVDPTFNEENWKHIATFKLENTNGDWYWIGQRDHWFRQCPPQEGFFTHPDYPDQLVRIAGFHPEYGVYLFEKR